MANTFIAQFNGECFECGGRIAKGEEIARTGEHEYVHADTDRCASMNLNIPKGAEVCGSCFLYHLPGACDR